MAEYMEAPAKVVEIAQDLIAKYHEHLLDARIGFIMRLDTVKKAGKEVLGKARKVNAEQQMFMDLDFVIWLNNDFFKRAEPRKKRALIDHELCHCKFDPNEDVPARIVGHDIEEFNIILDRYGFWLPSYSMTADAIQGRLGITKHTGKVVSLASLDGIELPPDKAERIREVVGEFERLGYTEEQALQMVSEFNRLIPRAGIDEVTLSHRDANGNVLTEVTMTGDQTLSQADEIEETLEQPEDGMAD